MSDLVLGATSGIGKALVRRFAAEGGRLILSGRDEEELRRLAADAVVRGAAEAIALPVDAGAFEAHAAWAEELLRVAGDLDRVAVLTGALGDLGPPKEDAALARALIDVNLTGVVSLLTPVVAAMRTRGSGRLAIVSSVAGDRGRGSNYPYGAPKAGLSAWADGLRHALWRDGVHVMTVKPGFVDTAMTWGKPGMFLVARPEQVAEAIARGLRRRRRVLYVPWFWRPLMWVIRCLPEWLFLRSKL